MSNRDTNNKQILMVEDSEDDYEMAERAFRKANLLNPLIWMQTGEDALDYLYKRNKFAESSETARPSIILLDLNMPGISGRHVLKKIKQDPSLANIPVIILTTSSDPRDVADCYESGANTYITKPVSFDGFIQAVKSLKEYWFEIAILPKVPDED